MSKKQVMVVEDESIVASDIQLSLKKMGYEVPAVVSSGEEAIIKAGELRPDIVLMDIMLNGEMTGIEAAGHIHSDQNIPFIYLTAYADDETLKLAKITDPFGYILKPFDDRELHGSIEMALYRHEMERQLNESRARFAYQNRSLQESSVEIKRLLKLSEEKNEELIEKSRELENMASDLARSNKELEQFAYVASHDLQEPLRMVSSYVQLLARRYKGKLGNDGDEFIEFAVDGASRMQELIKDLLAYSRVGTQSKEFEPVECTEVIERVIQNLKVAIDESGANVTYDNLPAVLGDQVQLVQLFQNLIENAIKYRDRAPLRIHINAERKNREWIISVCDNGIGIDNEFAESIFVIFKRLHDRKKYEGTGIGLAICKKIVERHGGRIWVEGESRIGSSFCFTIPVLSDRKG